MSSIEVQQHLIDEGLINFGFVSCHLYTRCKSKVAVNKTQGELNIKVHYSPQLENGRVEDSQLEVPKNARMPIFDSEEVNAGQTRL